MNESTAGDLFYCKLNFNFYLFIYFNLFPYIPFRYTDHENGKSHVQYVSSNNLYMG